MVLGLSVTLGNYTFTSDFYVIYLIYLNMILGGKWLYSFGKHTMDYQVLEMEVRAPNGNKDIL